MSSLFSAQSAGLSRRSLFVASAAICAGAWLPAGLVRAGEHAIERRRQYVDARFGQIHLWRYAPRDPSAVERPPLLCLHPNPYSGYFYDEFASAMASDRVVLCPDTPGFGSSERPPSPVAVADYAHAFADMLLALGYGEGAAGAVDVLGFHTGAVLAAELGIERPMLVNHVLLVGLPFYVDDSRQAELHAQLAREKAYIDDVDALGQEWREYVEWQEHKLSRDRLLSLFAEQLRAGREVWWPYDAVFTWPGKTRLPQLQKPTLLLAEGEALYQPTVDAKAFIPNATLWEYPEIQAPAFNAYFLELAALVRRFTDPACKC